MSSVVTIYGWRMTDWYAKIWPMRLEDLPKHSPGFALVWEVDVDCEYRLGGGGAGGPCGGWDGALFTRTGAGLTNLIGVAAEPNPRTPPITIDPFWS